MSETLTAPAAAEATEPKRAEKKAPTTYHVLRQMPASSPGSEGSYEVFAKNLEAGSATAAVRAAAALTDTDKPQTFVAVPSRSFKLVTVAVETKKQLVLS